MGLIQESLKMCVRVSVCCCIANIIVRKFQLVELITLQTGLPLLLQTGIISVKQSVVIKEVEKYTLVYFEKIQILVAEMPCHELEMCPGCTPPLAQCQLGMD